MKVGFTGTRTGMSSAQKTAFRRLLSEFGGNMVEFHHGDCVGADAEAHEMVQRLTPHVKIIIHPPDIDSGRAFCKGAAEVLTAYPYLERNHRIVDAVHALWAAPNTTQEVRRSGTWATVRYAKSVTARMIILTRPSGEQSRYTVTVPSSRRRGLKRKKA